MTQPLTLSHSCWPRAAAGGVRFGHVCTSWPGMSGPILSLLCPSPGMGYCPTEPSSFSEHAEAEMGADGSGADLGLENTQGAGRLLSSPFPAIPAGIPRQGLPGVCVHHQVWEVP